MSILWQRDPTQHSIGPKDPACAGVPHVPETWYDGFEEVVLKLADSEGIIVVWNAMEWCKERLGTMTESKTWHAHVPPGGDRFCFSFKDPKMAMMFKLTWA